MQARFAHLITSETNEVCWVTIDRPGDRNSLNSELIDELAHHLESVEKSSVRAVVYTGVGDTYFIGGADGVEMKDLSSEQAKSFSTKIQELFNRMESSPLLLVAAINGLCFGGGFEFALACDLRVASENALIGLPEVKVGLIPGGGGTQRLPCVVGIGKAMEMILTGHLYPAKEALQLGLIHRLATSSGLKRECDEWLHKILLRPQYALSAAKHAVHVSQRLPLAQGLGVEQEEFAACFSHNYFCRLMEEQLASGRLQTTAKEKRTGEG